MRNPSYFGIRATGSDWPLFMTTEDFAERFPSESHQLEWKSGISRKAIQEAIVAFSNADGGTIMLGVDDQGQPLGKELDEGLEKTLWEIIHEIESPGQTTLGKVVVGKVPLAIVSVERRRQGISQTSDGRPLIRLGKQNLPLKGENLRRLLNKRTTLSFDGDASPWLADSVDPALVAELCKALEIPYPPDDHDLIDVLVQRELAVRQGPDVVLTFAGALYLVPDAPRALGKCHIEIYRYQRGAKEHDRRVLISGTPAKQVRDATSWISEQLGFDLVIVGSRRYEMARLPPRAIREVLANAVAHRDYQLSGSAIVVRVTPHKVEVTSPGGFVDPVTRNNLLHAQSARNRRLITVLRYFGLAEDAGRGIRVILDEMAADLRMEPVFDEEITGHITVRLPIESPVAPEERAWVKEQETRGHLQDLDRRLLIEAARGVVLDNSTARNLLHVGSYEARQSLQRLRDAGFLEQHGIKGGARYRLAVTINPPEGVPLSKKEMRSLVHEMARNGPITNRLVRSQLGLTRYQVSDLLRLFAEDGLLERRGAKRGSHYVLREHASE